MTKPLFVYGTLAPGRANESILAPLAGAWLPATVKGHLKAQGWGAALGFPGLVLDENGSEIRGFVFAAEGLGSFWPTLDAFEGEQYERVVTEARLADGSAVTVFVYVLSEPSA